MVLRNKYINFQQFYDDSSFASQMEEIIDRLKRIVDEECPFDTQAERDRILASRICNIHSLCADRRLNLQSVPYLSNFCLSKLIDTNYNLLLDYTETKQRVDSVANALKFLIKELSF